MTTIRPATPIPPARPPRLPAAIPPPPPPTSPPEELPAGTDRLLGTATASTAGVWPRAVALLLRHALEEALRRYWQARKPQLSYCLPHAQALCLESYADPDTARRWSATWAGLSRACHYHGYELAPTQGELCAWRDDVERVLGALAQGTVSTAAVRLQGVRRAMGVSWSPVLGPEATTPFVRWSRQACNLWTGAAFVWEVLAAVALRAAGAGALAAGRRSRVRPEPGRPCVVRRLWKWSRRCSGRPPRYRGRHAVHTPTDYW